MVILTNFTMLSYFIGSHPFGCLSTLLAVFLGIQSAVAQTTADGDATSTPPTETPDPTTGTILRPSDGETIMGGQPYTVSWTPPTAPGDLSVEMWGEINAFTYSEHRGVCDGYSVNTQCTKMFDDIPSAETWVWDVPVPYFNYSEISGWLGKPSKNISLAVFVSVRHDKLAASHSPWHATSGEFIVGNPNAEPSTSTSRRARPTRTAGTNDEESGMAEDEEEDGAVRFGFEVWVWGLVGLIVVVVNG